MAIQLRDTQFGHGVRLVSDNKLFQYPDEIDQFLWKRCISQSTIDAFSKSGAKGDPIISEEGEAKQYDTNADLELSRNQTIENEKATGLVHWYGSDDPEVSAPVYIGQRSG